MHTDHGVPTLGDRERVSNQFQPEPHMCTKQYTQSIRASGITNNTTRMMLKIPYLRTYIRRYVCTYVYTPV